MKYITSCNNSSGGATSLHCNKTKKHSSKCFSHVERQDQEGNLGFFSASGETCPTFKYFPRRRHCHQLDRHLWHVLKRKKHSTTSMFCCWLVCHQCDQTAGDLYHSRCSRKVRPRSASAEHQQSLESTIATRCLHQLNNPRAIIFLITFATIAFIPGPKTNQRHFDKACETLKFDANRH